MCRNSVILLWPDKNQQFKSRLKAKAESDCAKDSSGSRGLVPMAVSRRQGRHWGSVSGAHLVVLVSADVQGCRGHL